MMVELSKRAEADFLAIVDQLSDFSVDAARRFIESFEHARLQLRDFPESGPRSAGARTKRTLHVGVYQFRYVLLRDRVVIRRIVDGRRRP